MADAPAVLLDAFGVTVGVDVDGAGASRLVGAVREAWSRCLVPDPAAEPEVRLRVWCDDAPAAGAPVDLAGADVDDLMHQLSPAVTRTAIDARAGRLMMLHGAALADPASGRTVAFVAPSGTGKTTLAIELGRHLSYLTDETVALTDDGAVVPYPKPLSIVGDHAWRKAQASPDSLGLLPTVADPRLAALVVLRRDPAGPEVPDVAQLRTAEALVALAPETSYLARHRRALHALADVVEHVSGVHEVRYREADTLGPVVVDLLDTPPVTHGSWLRRGAVDDLLLPPDGSGVVLSGSDVLLISDLAAHLLHLLPPGRWMPTDDVVMALVDAFGEPPGGRDEVFAPIVDDLRRRGLVETSVTTR